jgi:hypothetical protein
MAILVKPNNTVDLFLREEVKKNLFILFSPKKKYNAPLYFLNSAFRFLINQFTTGEIKLPNNEGKNDGFL